MRVPDEAYRVVVRPLYRLHSHIYQFYWSLASSMPNLHVLTPLLWSFTSNHKLIVATRGTCVKYTVWTIIRKHVKNNVAHVGRRKGSLPPPPKRSVGTPNKLSMFVLMYKIFFECVFCEVI